MSSRLTIENFGDPRLAIVKANLSSLEGIAIAIIALAKKLVPVDTGQLQNTLMYITPTSTGGFNESPGELAPESEQLDLPVKKNNAVVGSGSKHWYPEFGTYRMIAQPFLRPAFLFFAKGRKAADIIKQFNQAEMAKELKGRVKTGFRII